MTVSIEVTPTNQYSGGQGIIDPSFIAALVLYECDAQGANLTLVEEKPANGYAPVTFQLNPADGVHYYRASQKVYDGSQNIAGAPSAVQSINVGNVPQPLPNVTPNPPTITNITQS